jgi:serine/threonine protein kinase/Flp pilus assembly protein TadD
MAAPHSFTPAEWARIEPILDEVLDLDPPDRPAAIARACGADASLKAHVEALVAADTGAAEFLETPAAEYAAVVVRAGAAGPADNEPQGCESPGDLIGPYRLIREIGHGGMGRVFLATRADGQFEQQVALKLVRGAASGGEIHARFLRERQILARLEHPHIARLLDGGVTLDGRPYFAMEYVDGEPITAYCERRALDLQQRLELFTAVCDAVQYAHQNLVIHRDLKPSNTLVTPEGTVKLLDFGIAKVLHQEEHDPFDATLTRLGSGPMTPEYAAPEQVRGEPVTAATDVYALGALAYELLTGRGPHALTRLTAAEVERVITQGAVDRPSQAALKPPRGRDGAAGGLTPAARAQRLKLRRQLKGDLDTILLQALQKEPARRYATAGAFVEDIRRYQRGLPIAARRDSFGYRAGKFVRRNALGVGATVLVLASLVVGLIGTAWQARVASREAAKAREVSRFLSSLFEVADPARANAEGISARELLDRGAARIESELSDQPEVQAEMMLVLGRISRELSLFDRAQTLLDRSLKLRTEFRGQFGLAAGRTRGRASEDVAEVTTELARLALDRGRPDEAERLHRGALGMRRAVLGDSHASVGTSMRDLAGVVTSRGKYDEAERLLRDALVLHEKLYGPKHEEIASDLEGLQSTLRLRGEPAEAIAAARRCLDMRLELLGTDHLDTATAMNNLAILLLDRWELAEAEKLYRQVLAFDLRRLGELHSNTATVTNNLAFVLRDRGQYEEAERLYRSALDLDKRLFGAEHPYVATVMGNLAAVLLRQGKLDEAEQLYRGSLAMFTRVYGQGHWRIGAVQGGLAAVLGAKGDESAEALYRGALAHLEKTLQAKHPQLEPVLIGLGKELTRRGRPEEAEPLLRRALETRTARLGDGDPRTAEVRVRLGICLAALGKSDEARTLLTAGHERLRTEPYFTPEVQEAARALASPAPQAHASRLRPQ